MITERDINIILSTEISWKKLDGKSVLVTGATGRLGIYIAHALFEVIDRWKLETNIFLMARSQEKILKVYGSILHREDVKIILQDITTPIKIEGQVDYIFHTAGLASPFDFTYHPIETLWGHVQGTKNILDLAVEKKCRRILYVSTVEIYGKWNGDNYIKETDMGPMSCNKSRSCYPEAKRLCETMLACYKYEHGLDYVGVRLSHTLGPGISLADGRAFAEFIQNMLRGEDIVLHSEGNTVRTYTYTADAAGAMFLALLDGKDEYYNVATTKNQISIRDLAQLIASMSKTGSTKVKYADNIGSELSYLPYRQGILDTSRIEALGWKPKVGIDQLFRWTIESFQN